MRRVLLILVSIAILVGCKLPETKYRIVYEIVYPDRVDRIEAIVDAYDKPAVRSYRGTNTIGNIVGGETVQTTAPIRMISVERQ